jgi:hypothetical protein
MDARHQNGQDREKHQQIPNPILDTLTRVRREEKGKLRRKDHFHREEKGKCIMRARVIWNVFGSKK